MRPPFTLSGRENFRPICPLIFGPKSENFRPICLQRQHWQPSSRLAPRSGRLSAGSTVAGAPEGQASRPVPEAVRCPGRSTQQLGRAGCQDEEPHLSPREGDPSCHARPPLMSRVTLDLVTLCAPDLSRSLPFLSRSPSSARVATTPLPHPVGRRGVVTPLPSRLSPLIHPVPDALVTEAKGHRVDVEIVGTIAPVPAGSPPSQCNSPSVPSSSSSHISSGDGFSRLEFFSQTRSRRIASICRFTGRPDATIAALTSSRKASPISSNMSVLRNYNVGDMILLCGNVVRPSGTTDDSMNLRVEAHGGGRAAVGCRSAAIRTVGADGAPARSGGRLGAGVGLARRSRDRTITEKDRASAAALGSRVFLASEIAVSFRKLAWAEGVF